MLKKIGLFLAVIFVFLIGLFFFINAKMNGKVSDSDREQRFEIIEGEGLRQISQRLEEAGLITNSFYFDAYVWKAGRQSQIITGTYSLRPNMTIPEIVNLVTSGKDMESKDLKITIVEGWTKEQIADYLDKEGVVAKEDFLGEVENVLKYKEKYVFLSDLSQSDTLEGYLFPDTYLIYPNSDSEEIITKMLNNFDEKVDSEIRQAIQESARAMKDVIIMASIIEREISIKTEKDRENQKIVAGIFWNRLRDAHPLQSCATVNYIIGAKKQLSLEDTKVESPYNTYLHPGLPPGPISNPGLEAILAAVYPKDSNYYYFLNDLETGELYFSETNEEHNQKKAEHGL
ncbi:MAG: endolytic transglycosylase MltG [Candidatus Moranbacteria bacterium]|nr:endolytic transglycosylase MltG [Candidatus Moranbacteria bacterium]